MDVGPEWTRDSYLFLVGRTLWTELPRVLWGAFLFSLCCGPAFLLFSLGFLTPTLVVSIVTIAPAWAALQADQLALLQGIYRPYSYFGQALFVYGRRALQLGLLLGFPLLAVLLTLSRLQQDKVTLGLWLWLGLLFLVIAVIGALSLYTFPLLVYFDHGLQTTLRNAWILAARYPFHTLGLLGLGILLGFGVVYLSLGLLFLLPALYGLFAAGNCLLVLAMESDKMAG